MNGLLGRSNIEDRQSIEDSLRHEFEALTGHKVDSIWELLRDSKVAKASMTPNVKAEAVSISINAFQMEENQAGARRI